MYKSIISDHFQKIKEAIVAFIMEISGVEFIHFINMLNYTLQLMFESSFVNKIDIITIVTQKCIITIILKLLYIQLFDKSQFKYEKATQNCIQVLASIIGLFLLKTFFFGQVNITRWINVAYNPISTMRIEYKDYDKVLISLIVMLPLLLFTGNIQYQLICLFQPLSQVFIQIIKYLMNDEIEQFQLVLYTNLIGLPIYIMLSLFNGNVQNIFDMTYFFDILTMCISQMLVYLAFDELKNQYSSYLYNWTLFGCIIMLSMVFMYREDEVILIFLPLLVILIMFASISIQRQT
ncbi:unnamed protein product [Paramecium primaurelia]|uniref:Transmembrane protein n=1 Tax=Paramecium primaurelia TaxID=5886 RepID=A0A8S1MSK1_PARPR|nr:unnamed protein product [Paramecium primaurelia]